MTLRDFRVIVVCAKPDRYTVSESPIVNSLDEATSPIMSKVSLLDSDQWPDSDRRQSLAGSLAIGLWNNKGKINSTCQWNFVVWIVQEPETGTLHSLYLGDWGGEGVP